MSRRKSIFRLVLAAGLLWFGLEVVSVVGLKNLHEVVPDRIYRSAQLSGEQLRELADEKGVRTVVNLRGFCPGFDWYDEECAAVQEAGLTHADVRMSASRLPPPRELRRLIEVLDKAEYPVVIHCRRGADRTGLACGVVALLYTDGGMSAARWQSSPRFGHLGIGPTSAVDRFFTMYEEHLTAEGQEHSPSVFREWALNDYKPGAAAAELRFAREPGKLPAGRPISLPIVAENRSDETWRLTPGTGSGVRARYLLCRSNGEQRVLSYAGLYERDVPPGESLELNVALPPLEAGAYVLYVDMIDADDTAFSQVGTDPIQRELIVE